MRLEVLETGHTVGRKVLLGAIRLLSGHAAPDVLRTLWYRPEFFGHPFSRWTQRVMRGPSDWSVGERELFAAFTSRVNNCRF